MAIGPLVVVVDDDKQMCDIVEPVLGLCESVMCPENFGRGPQVRTKMAVAAKVFRARADTLFISYTAVQLRLNLGLKKMDAAHCLPSLNTGANIRPARS